MTTLPAPHPGQAALIAELQEQGLLSPSWREAWEQTPRHLFLPERIWRQQPDRCEPVQSEDERYELIYSDEPVITQLDNGRLDGPGLATSSNSMPSMVARMLDALDVRTGTKTLEIGTATGQVAALLSRVTGDAAVYSIEVDEDLAAQATAHLASLGLSPTIVVGDGEAGLPQHAPYDRVIATCALRYVPAALRHQLVAGGVLVAPMTDSFYGGALVKLLMDGDGVAQGHFLHGASYMPMRSHRQARPAPPEATTARSRDTDLAPERVFPLGFALYGSARLPGVAMTHGYREGIRHVWLQDRHGSAAVAAADGRVTEYGPRDLRREIEAVQEEYVRLGSPAAQRFGLTADRDGQHLIWLDVPEATVPAKTK